MQLINTKSVIKRKLKKSLNGLKKVQAILVLDHAKINDRKIFRSSAKLIASDSDIHEILIFLSVSIRRV